MDGNTIQQIREHLLERWTRLEKAAGREIQTASELDQQQAEIIDIAQSLEQIGRDTSLAEQDRRELAAVERALSKISTGSFGVCEECGENIPPRRLMVMPAARLCAHCQAFEERQNARTRAIGA